jgi:PDZ domain-containing protein
VAFRQVGVPVVEHDVGAVVYVVLTRSPAWGHVQVGDVVRAVDATSVTNASGLVAAIRSHRPGDVVTLTLGSVTDPAKSHEVRVRLGADPERPGVGFLGVIAFTQPSYGLPERVSIFDDGIGGPSAGLAFTLGLIDDLVGGDLTGGKVVAATGTIRPDGTVGAVGGVPQKTVAVARAGASVFLVPASEAPSAKRVAPRTLRVVPVDDLRQALAVLASLGGHLGAAASGPPPGPGGHSAPAGWQDAPWY